MEITKLLHTAILVSDLDKSAHFYGNVLGLTKVDRSLKYPGVWYQIGDYQIHLIVHPEFKKILDNEEKLGRNPHIAMAVTDLEQAKQKLATHGYPFQVSASGRQALFTQDPDGNIIEISQQLPD